MDKLVLSSTNPNRLWARIDNKNPMQLSINQMFNFTPPHIAKGGIKDTKKAIATHK